MRPLVLLLLAVASPAAASLTRAQLETAVARPPAGAHLPGSLAFDDPHGQRRTLAQVADGRPMVLLFADYTCRHVCGPGLALTAGALADAGLVPGRDVSFAVVGLDPHDGAPAATTMADAMLAGQPVARRGVHLLLGTPATIAAAERALGYRAVYDAATDQFAHDAAVYVFAPDGHLAALLPELALNPASLRAAVVAPASGQEGWTSRAAHLCYGFAAAQGRFGRPIVLALQALAALGLVLGGGWLWRRRGTA